MAVPQLEAKEAGESWERINKKLLEEANRAVRAFTVNRVGCSGGGRCIMPELTSPRTLVVVCGFRHSAAGESEKKLSESLPLLLLLHIVQCRTAFRLLYNSDRTYQTMPVLRQSVTLLSKVYHHLLPFFILDTTCLHFSSPWDILGPERKLVPFGVAQCHLNLIPIMEDPNLSHMIISTFLFVPSLPHSL